MINSKKLIHILPVSLLIFFIGNSSVWACTIEKGPSPLLVAYIQDVQKRMGEIRNFASANNKCSGTAGTFSNENRFLELIDRVSTQSPIGGDIVSDFRYNVMLAAAGESKSPVISHGKLIENLEKNTIIMGLKQVSSACALDEKMLNGNTPQEEIAGILRNNRALEGYFKNIALGDTRQPEDLTPYMKSLYDEIRDNYSPGVTATCKGNGETGNIEDVMKKIQERLQGQAKNTNKSQDSWAEAIALFSGKGASTKKYQDLQRRLLSTELARQGLTQKARDAMLKNLSCFQQKTTPTSTPEEMGSARADCTQSVIIGAENLTNWMKPLVFKATNTDEFIRRALTYEKAKTRLGPDMATFWKKIQDTKNADEKLNEKMITDLVNIHAELTLTNDLLKKKSSEMYKNCMKAQPDIPCPQP